MITRPRWTKTTLIFTGTAIWGLILIGCVSVSRTMLAPPQVAGANFIGSKECVQCHEDQTAHFETASHARLALADPRVGDTGCEACHGPGSIHAAAGGSRGTIVNPRKSPETCFQCHLDKRAQFSLPNSHGVLSGKMGCSDCHEVHKGNAIAGTGADLEGMNATCTKCHTQQKGPFVYEHGAMREGCIACHNPHGTINAKMLVARDANLCLRCHLEAPDAGSSGQINANAIRHTNENHNSRLMQGTCWSAGCHEQPHGSNASFHFRN
jgi:predicted CXXCH cytochrome family protein